VLQKLPVLPMPLSKVSRSGRGQAWRKAGKKIAALHVLPGGMSFDHLA